jgi:hypothetical protein
MQNLISTICNTALNIVQKEVSGLLNSEDKLSSVLDHLFQMMVDIDRNYAVHGCFCKSLEERSIMHEVMLNDDIPIFVLQFLINQDIAIDSLDEARHTPFTIVLQKDNGNISEMQKLKLFLYTYNAMLIYALEPQKEEKNNTKKLVRAKKRLEWGFDDTENDKKILENFFTTIKQEKKQILKSKEFCCQVLQDQIRKINNHNIYNKDLIKETTTLLKEEGICDDEIQKWEKRLKKIREKYNLNQFIDGKDQEEPCSKFKKAKKRKPEFESESQVQCSIKKFATESSVDYASKLSPNQTAPSAMLSGVKLKKHWIESYKPSKKTL